MPPSKEDLEFQKLIDQLEALKIAPDKRKGALLLTALLAKMAERKAA